MTRHSVCALDCPDCCSLLINVDDSGRGEKLRGDPAHPVTQGFLCGKVARYLDREYSPQRLLHPLKRTGAKGEGRFERITWDHALDAIATRLHAIAATHGSESILPYSYAGTMGYLQSSGMDRRFFHRLGASRLDRTICSGAGIAGLTATQGLRYATEPEQFAQSKLIIAWGANILSTSVHLWPFIVEARRKGAKFYVIDPVATRTAKLADKHIRIYPGADLALALGLLHVIFAEGLEDADYINRYSTGSDSLRELAKAYPPARAEQLTGIPSDDIAALAREYATTRPAVLRVNYGVQRSERGGSAVRAIATLPIVTGSWREAGGGMQLSTSQAFHINRDALERPDLQNISLGRPGRLLNMSELGRVLEETENPPVRALVVYNSNPAAVVPDQHTVRRGLANQDLFTVVLEQFQTDTADFADIVLPVTTFLEHTDLYYAYGHYHMQLARPALPAPGEVKSNFEIFRLLAARMGFTGEPLQATEDDVIRDLLASGHRFLEGITIERLDREHSVRLNVSPPGEPFLPFVNGGFGFDGGRANLDATGLEYTPAAESRLGDESLLKAYPLEFLSPKNHDNMNSTFGESAAADRQAAVLAIHSADAAARSIHNGDLVRVYNGRASLRLTAEVDGKVAPGVVASPSTRWPKLSLDGLNANALISDRLADIGGSPAFYSCLVEVERCGD